MTARQSLARLRHARTVAAALACFVTAACGADTTFWSPAAAPKANRLQLVHLNHDVAFTRQSIQMDAADSGELDAFLARNDIGYGDRVYVVGSAREANPIATRRAQGIALHLRRRGLDPTVLPSAEWAGTTEPDQIRVLVHRFVVHAPNCPDWRKPPTDYGNTEASNFGCANAVNFGMMLADPRELVEGRHEGQADGEREAAAIKRYRDGKVTPLEKMGTAP